MEKELIVIVLAAIIMWVRMHYKQKAKQQDERLQKHLHKYYK